MLIEYGNGLLDTAFGLADDPNCCCTGDPCPPCCITIDSGALIDGEIKIFDSVVVVDAGVDKIASIEITITTESGTRQVCHGESISVRVESFLDGMAATSVPIQIITDPIWEMTDAPGADDHQVRPGGWAIWENESEAEATLELNACFFNATDVSAFYGGLGNFIVRVGTSHAYFLEEVISVIRCQPSVNCCTRMVECEPCCLTMPNDESGVVLPYWTWSEKRQRWERLYHIRATKTTTGGGDPGDVTTNDDITYWVVVWIQGAFPTRFCPDDPINMGMDIGFQESLFKVGLFSVIFSLCELEYVSPSPGGASVNTSPLTVEWTDEDDTGYEVTFTHNCSFPLGDCSITFSASVTGTGIVGGAGFWDPAEGAGLLDLTYCPNPDNIDCCDCCCDCDLSGASITDLDITDGGTRYRLIGGPYSLANNPLNPCFWIIGIQIHGSGSAIGTVELGYCETVNGWRLQGFNSITDWIRYTEPGPCNGQINVNKPGATGFITIEGGKDCPGIE